MKFIVLSAGHGGTDPGALGNGYKEHELAWDLVKRIRDYINSNYTGQTINTIEEKNSNGQFKSVGSYWSKASSGGGYSIHFNAASSSSAHGTEVLQGNFGSSRCNTINSALANFFTNRGIKKVNTNDYYMLREAGMDMIIEICFISNSSDMEIYQKNKSKIVAALGDAIAKNEGLTKKSNTTTENKPNKYTSAEKIDSQYPNGEKDRAYYNYKKMVCDVPVYSTQTGKQSGTIKKGRNQIAFYSGLKNGRKIAKFYSNGSWHFFYIEKP